MEPRDEVDETLIARVLQLFGLEERPAGVRLAGAGRIGRAYRIDLGAVPLLLRASAPRPNDVRFFARKHAFLNALAEDFPHALAPRRSASGTSTVTYDRRVWELWPFVVGETGRTDAPATCAAVTGLARLHAMTARRYRPYLAPAGMRGHVSWLIEEFGRMPGSLARDCRALAERTATEAARLGDAPAGIEHGDFHPKNVVWCEKAPFVVFLDFDAASLSDGYYDLAVACDTFCRRDGGTLSLEAVTHLLRAYRSERHLPPDGGDRLAEALVTFNLARTHMRLKRGTADDGLLAEDYAARANVAHTNRSAVREAFWQSRTT